MRPRGGHGAWRLSAGGDVEGRLLIESHPVLAPGAHVELAHPPGLSIRASVRRTLVATVMSDSIGRFTWTWARLDCCPVRIGRQVAVRPCVLGETGGIDATGVGGTSTIQRGRPWATVGGLIRLAAHLGPVALSADVGLAAPINRESFVFVPSPTVYQIPPWIAFSGVTLAGDWTP